MFNQTQLRSPIVTVVGHVDHGKTSILDCFRETSVQDTEAGGITQKISFTKYPIEQIEKSCPLIKKQNIKLDIPGFLFIDTPGHAAFISLRKRGGSLADLAILVISIKEGIKPQTAEVLQILKANKTPFLIALNKIDSISGWHKKSENLKESIKQQNINVYNEFEESLLTFQGSLQEHGFQSELFFSIKDFTKEVAIVPCSARTKEGIQELLFVLVGLCQKFLRERLKISEEARGVILEIKKTKSQESIEAILYDGSLKEGDEIAIASFNEAIITKIRALEEIKPLTNKYFPVKKANAATGLKLHLTNKEDILPGMLFQKIDNNLEKIKKEFKKEISGAIKLDKQGIIIKANSLGSLEALMILLKQENIKVLKAGIGQITKIDVLSAKANKEINELDSVIIGFNIEKEEELDTQSIKIITNPIIYKLIEDLQKWRKEKLSEIERDKILGLATISKLEILHQYIFRNSAPAIFGVRVITGKIKTGIPLIDNSGESVARLKSLQVEKESVKEALEGAELAISLPGIAFDRKLKEKNFLYADLSEKQFKEFKKHKDLLSSSELKVLQEIADIKRKGNENWGL